MGTYKFTGELQRWRSPNGDWWFIRVSDQVSDEILELPLPRRGFGAVRVQVQVGTSEWGTSIFPSNRIKAYMLPIKAQIRKTEQLGEGDLVMALIKIV